MMRPLFPITLRLLTFGCMGALSLSACKGNDSAEAKGLGGSKSEVSACAADEDCNDYIFCNGEESCELGVCVRGAPVVCDDGIDCTVDLCLEQEQRCSSTAQDNDGDGHGDAACLDADGLALGDDCDDNDARSFPGNAEVCDADNRDEDCDPATFGDRDTDNDGYIDAACCNPDTDGALRCGTDCDDNRTNVNPAGTEACDFLDNNCDTKVDEGVSVQLYPDTDHDGHGDESSASVATCAGAVGFAAVNDDCDDSDPEVFKGQFEICDGKDNNCNGKPDEIEEQAPWYKDADGDGYGDAESVPVFSCYRVAGRVLSRNDCDDSAKTVNPNATEICDALDNDCNGLADFRLSGINNFEDDDADGIADSECGGEDCNDKDARTGGGQDEVCDRVDNDCDGEVDEQTVQNIWYTDDDGDGWGVVLGSALASCEPLAGRATQFGDCNDSDSSVRPGVTEYCDGVDNDCDGKIDEGAAVHCNLDHAFPMCRYGQCLIFSCMPGFVDTDKNPQNGCEAVDTNPPASGVACSYTSECDDGDLCNGFESCSSGACRAGMPINCAAAPGVLEGDALIAGGQDIVSLSDVIQITGDLYIDGSALTSLIGLENLRVIAGSLYIRNNNNLLRLSGSALSNLETVGGDIVIDNNGSLQSVNLPSLLSARSLTVSNNPNLKVVDGYANLTNLTDGLEIFGNKALTNIKDFDSLSRLNRLWVYQNQSLLAVSGFNALAVVEHHLFVGSNPKLMTLGGLSSLYSVGGSYTPGPKMSACQVTGLVIQGNPALSDISAFGNLSEVAGDLCVLDAPAKLLDFASLRSVGVSLGVAGGAPEELQLPVLETVGFQFFVEAYIGEELPRIISAPQLTDVVDTVGVSGSGSRVEELDLGALQGAPVLEIDLTAEATALAVLDLSGLQSVGSFYLHYASPNPQLASIDLDALTTASSGFTLLVQDPGVLTLDVSALASVGGTFNVSSTLASANAAVYFDALQSIGGDMILKVATGTIGVGNLLSVGGNLSGATTDVCVAPSEICSALNSLLSNSYKGSVINCQPCP